MTGFFDPKTLATLLVVLEGIGVLAFAASGLLAGATKRLDAVGVAVIAFLTAFGGGTLRDLLLDRGPFFWVANEGWVWAVIVLAVVGPVVLRSRHIEPTAKAMQWPDAVGLGLFAASGTQVALDSGASALVATLMGVVTAVFGGMIRDILVNEIPWVVSSYQLYAVIAFAGGWLVWAFGALGLDPVMAVSIGALVTIALRILAIVFNWRLPAWR
ncbi:MAG: trimeric intracellular cation channel family protein [Microbacteriaceae bacterium]